MRRAQSLLMRPHCLYRLVELAGDIGLTSILCSNETDVNVAETDLDTLDDG
jgi:hypothetical protein